jgi:hypothetical protein
MNKIIIIIIIVLAFFLILVSVMGIKSNKPDKYGPNSPVRTCTSFSLICIEGHVYYSFYNAITPKLTDDGKPCPCNIP